MIRKLKSGGYRLCSMKIDPRTGKRRNLGTFKTRTEAEKHERAVQYFKRSRNGQAVSPPLERPKAADPITRDVRHKRRPSTPREASHSN
jgi:hypothetical protein